MRPPEKVLRDAQECLSRGGGALEALPTVIRRILEDGVWRNLPDKNGECFVSFPAFVEYPLWWGLETKFSRLVEFCKDDKECHRLLLEAMPQARPPRKKGASGDNVTTSSRGNSSSHTIKRLKRDHPDLAERVIAGDISAHAAAIRAGFRKPSITLQANNAQHAADRIRDVLGDEFALQLKEAL